MNETTDQNEAKPAGSLAASIVAVGAAVLAAVLFCMVRKDALVTGYDKAVLAALLAAAVVAGARALGDTQPQTGARKRSAPPAAIEMARSWLLCFIALAAAFLLNDLVARYQPATKGGARSGDVLRVSGSLTVVTPERTQNVSIAGQAGK